MLDRICAELARSADAVAEQQLQVDEPLRTGPYQPPLPTLVIPVIVTTAQLQVCRFDPSAVSLKTGNIPDDAKFEEVPSVRYRKSFDTSHPPVLSPGATLGTLERHAQRTVLVVTASEFPRWLRGVRH